MLKKIKKYIGNRFIKFINLYILTIIIINKILDYNNKIIYKYNWENLIIIYIISYIAIYKID